MISPSDIRLVNDPILREISIPLGPKDFNMATYLAIENMRVALLRDRNAAAVAAPQVGISKRIFVWNFLEMPVISINPVIIDKSDKCNTDLEGCLSIPNFSFPVKRHNWVTIEYVTFEGQKKTYTTEGFLARLFQHEIDHLDGILSIDYLEEDEKNEVLSKF